MRSFTCGKNEASLRLRQHPHSAAVCELSARCHSSVPMRRARGGRDARRTADRQARARHSNVAAISHALPRLFSRGRRHDVRAERRHPGDVAARLVLADDSLHPLPNRVSGAARALRRRHRAQRPQHPHRSVRQRPPGRLPRVGAQVGGRLACVAGRSSPRSTGDRRTTRPSSRRTCTARFATIVATY